MILLTVVELSKYRTILYFGGDMDKKWALYYYTRDKILQKRMRPL